MPKFNGPGKLKACCKLKNCSDPRKKTPCGECRGCEVKENCTVCVPCVGNKKKKRKTVCVERICLKPVWLGKVGQEEQIILQQQQDMVDRVGPAGDQALQGEPRKLAREDLGFATTPNYTPFPARLTNRVSVGDRVIVTFYATGESAFISRSNDWQPYTLELEQELLSDSSISRSGFRRGLAELQVDLASLASAGGEEAARLRAISLAALGAPRQLGPLSGEGLIDDRVFNKAAFQEKIVTSEHGKWNCKNCPRFETRILFEAKRHARICGQRPKVQMPKSTAVKLPCSACAQKFASMTDLNDHYKNVHKENFRPRRCPDCRKIFVDEAGLKVHRKNYHSDADKGEKVVFSCTSCAYTSKFKGNFKRHMRTVHRVRDKEDLIVTGDKELHDKVDDPIEEGENAETSEYEREVSDPVLDAMNDKIEELMRRLPELYPGEQKKLNNLLERRLRWKEELMKHPEFEEQQVKQKQGRKRQKKRCAEETGARKSARLSKEQVDSTQEDQELEQGHVQELEQGLVQELEQGHVQELEQDSQEVQEVLEAQIMSRFLVEEVVNSVLGENKCDICGKVFRCWWSLVRQHIKLMHTPGQVPFKCSKGFCKEEFATKYEMVGHLLTCSFTCQYCGKLITRSGRVEGHIRRCKGLG